MEPILLIDDDTTVRAAILDMLLEAGYPVVACSGGEQALERLPSIDPSLIILDLMMPGMDGADFLTRLRRMSGWSDVPVLIISGIGHALLQSIDAERARAENVRGVIGKPVSFETLIGNVSRIVGRPR